MEDGYIGEIRMFAGNFAPRDWAFCNGQLLSIASNNALYAIVGTTYGGDGQTTFALPDLRGRTPIGPGAGPGLSNVNLGYRGGAESAQLDINQMPAHNHSATVSGASGTLKCGAGFGSDGTSPDGAYPGVVTGGTPKIYNSSASGTMAADAVSLTGGYVTVNNTGSGQPFPIRNPYLGVYYIICTDGIFPSRS